MSSKNKLLVDEYGYGEYEKVIL